MLVSENVSALLLRNQFCSPIEISVIEILIRRTVQLRCPSRIRK